MKYRYVFVILLALLTGACADTMSKKDWAGDSAIRRVDDCVCFSSIDGQNLKPWQIAWNEPEKLRQQISRCVCKAEIDIPRVENPKRYLVPGTTIK